MAEKQFLVSVADALLIDPDTKALVVKGKALLNSSIEQDMQSNDIFAGRGSKLVYTHRYQKVLNITIESADFSPTYLAMQTGSTIKNELSKYYKEELLTFDGTGKATVTETPIGDIYVELENGTNQSVTPATKDITVVALANKTAKVVYQYNTTVDVIDIPADTFPKAYELVLTSDIFNPSGKTFEMQVQVPKYLLDGKISLSLQHDQTGNTTLSGKSLVDTDGNYAYVKFLPVAGNAVGISSLAGSPSEVQLDHTVPTDSEQLTVIGIRGGVYSNIIMDNTKLTFTVDDATQAKVSASGLVELGTAPTAGSHTVVRITDGTHTDIVYVDIL